MRIVQQAAAVGFGGHKPNVNKLAKRRAARRRIAEGFPWQGKFETKKEIDDYLGGDTIVCLICGQQKRLLGAHILRMHQINDEEYRLLYGLPWSRGLVSASSLEKYRAASILRLSNNPEERDRCVERLRVFSGCNAPKRHMQPFHHEIMVAMSQNRTEEQREALIQRAKEPMNIKKRALTNSNINRTRDEEIISRLMDGESTHAIAAAYGISESRVSQIKRARK